MKIERSPWFRIILAATELVGAVGIVAWIAHLFAK